MTDTHIVPCDADRIGRNQWRARCGEPVKEHQFARNGEPTCQTCARLDAEDEAGLLSLQQMPATAPPAIRPPFDPCKGYVPRGQRRTR